MHRPGRGSSSLSLNIGRHRRGDVRWRLQLQRGSDSYNYQRQTNKRRGTRTLHPPNTRSSVVPQASNGCTLHR